MSIKSKKTAIPFQPTYTLTPEILQSLGRIAACKGKTEHVALSPQVLFSLRRSARLQSIHYSTFIEGNRLEENQISAVLEHQGHFPGREREVDEVLGYYAALTKVEEWAKTNTSLNDKLIQTLHALVMGKGKKSAKPSAYRDGQNAVYDGATRAIVYMPPEAADVPALMTGLINWIQENNALPCPLLAALAHYQFATIHPYYDGNGRTARLLATFIIHSHQYDLRGIYSLEEYYARDLNHYYAALSVGPSHNYYEGRAEADLTNWVAYFTAGMADACEKVVAQLLQESSHKPPLQGERILRALRPQQRKALQLFNEHEIITAQQLADFLDCSPRAASDLCKKWVAEGFLQIEDPAFKNRSYRLTDMYEQLTK